MFWELLSFVMSQSLIIFGEARSLQKAHIEQAEVFHVLLCLVENPFRSPWIMPQVDNWFQMGKLTLTCDKHWRWEWKEQRTIWKCRHLHYLNCGIEQATLHITSKGEFTYFTVGFSLQGMLQCWWEVYEIHFHSYHSKNPGSATLRASVLIRPLTPRPTTWEQDRVTWGPVIWFLW